jgi:FtsH-binding integral membrane protein
MTAAEISRNVLVGGLAILLVAMAARNYRRADTGRSTVLRQIAWLAGCGVLLTALHAAFIAVWMAFAAQR